MLSVRSLPLYRPWRPVSGPRSCPSFRPTVAEDRQPSSPASLEIHPKWPLPVETDPGGWQRQKKQLHSLLLLDRSVHHRPWMIRSQSQLDLALLPIPVSADPLRVAVRVQVSAPGLGASVLPPALADGRASSSRTAGRPSSRTFPRPLPVCSAFSARPETFRFVSYALKPFYEKHLVRTLHFELNLS